MQFAKVKMPKVKSPKVNVAAKAMRGEVMPAPFLPGAKARARGIQRLRGGEPSYFMKRGWTG